MPPYARNGLFGQQKGFEPGQAKSADAITSPSLVNRPGCHNHCGKANQSGIEKLRS